MTPRDARALDLAELAVRELQAIDRMRAAAVARARALAAQAEDVMIEANVEEEPLLDVTRAAIATLMQTIVNIERQISGVPVEARTGSLH